MKERPILFSDEMVRAILDGRKTQTRRVVKQQAVLDSRNDVGVWDGPGEVGEWEVSLCPYGTVGDRLWVREAWAETSDKDAYATIVYRADKAKAHKLCTLGGDGDPIGVKPVRTRTYPVACLSWKPSIHMPRWASRITLEITGVRVERLQDISEEDAKAEGPPKVGGRRVYPSSYAAEIFSYYKGFAELWDSINKDRGYPWESNPWVWVVNFKRIEA